MSAAKAMSNERRLEIYGSDMTPAQRRRYRHKANVAASERVQDGLGRYARLRRRFDRKDNREVALRGKAFVRLFGRRRAS